MTKQQGSLGIPNINNFWKVLRMSWFRWSINSKSTWSKLHNQEVSPYAFDPVKSNIDCMNKEGELNHIYNNDTLYSINKDINFKSTWSKLHNQEVSPYAFDPVRSNFDCLNKAKTIC